jgi:uncharacterized protein YkwD
LIAIASVVLVITPISWILLHQPQNDDADASVPIVTRTDDTYVTPTTMPTASTPPVPRPTTPKATPTPTPTDSATPTATPSTEPTDDPTTAPTEQGTTAPTAPPPPQRPTKKPSTTTAPPPPAVDGEMTADELQLFNMIDSTRTSNGCAPLEQDPDLTGRARNDATSRAKSDSKLNASGSSMTAAGGDEWTAQQAYNQMMAQSKSTVLNCNLTTLGVGKAVKPYCDSIGLFGICIGSTVNRVSWVADFT